MPSAQCPKCDYVLNAWARLDGIAPYVAGLPCPECGAVEAEPLGDTPERLQEDADALLRHGDAYPLTWPRPSPGEPWRRQDDPADIFIVQDYRDGRVGSTTGEGPFGLDFFLQNYERQPQEPHPNELWRHRHGSPWVIVYTVSRVYVGGAANCHQGNVTFVRVDPGTLHPAAEGAAQLPYLNFLSEYEYIGGRTGYTGSQPDG